MEVIPPQGNDFFPQRVAETPAVPWMTASQPQSARWSEAPLVPSLASSAAMRAWSASFSSRALAAMAEELRQSQNALNDITGEFSADDLLGVIFSSFCIGK